MSRRSAELSRITRQPRDEAAGGVVTRDLQSKWYAFVLHDSRASGHARSTHPRNSPSSRTTNWGRAGPARAHATRTQDSGGSRCVRRPAQPHASPRPAHRSRLQAREGRPHRVAGPDHPSSTPTALRPAPGRDVPCRPERRRHPHEVPSPSTSDAEGRPVDAHPLAALATPSAGRGRRPGRRSEANGPRTTKRRPSAQHGVRPASAGPPHAHAAGGPPAGRDPRRRCGAASVRGPTAAAPSPHPRRRMRAHEHSVQTARHPERVRPSARRRPCPQVVVH